MTTMVTMMMTKAAFITATRNCSSGRSCCSSTLFIRQRRQHWFSSSCHHRVRSLLLLQQGRPQRQECQIASSLSSSSVTRIRRRFFSSPTRSSSSKWNVDLDTGIISSTSTSSSSDDDRKFQTIIGLEIHAQLDIPTKLFSPSLVPTSSTTTSSSYKPNTYIHPMDMGVPGYLPRLSQSAVQYAVLSSAALNCSIADISRFERKHYFYADLPLGYQVTQQRWPIATNGILKCRRVPQKKGGKRKKTKNDSGDGSDDDEDTFTVRVERVQLEQDTGKTITTTKNVKGDDGEYTITESLVDFNRAGCALIEIVFHPDIRSAKDAAIAVETLRGLLQHINTCNGKMEEGSLRVDLNISIAPINDSDDDKNNDYLSSLLQYSGNRVEVKNLSSIKHVLWATEYESLRQVKSLVEDNKPTKQETRTFDVKTKKTVLMRTKEGAEDYRFMPEPDLPPIVLTNNEEVFDGLDLHTFLERRLPELPEEARRRLMEEYELSDYLATVITGDPPAIRLFDEAVIVAYDRVNLTESFASTEKETVQQRKLGLSQVAEAVANFLCNELFALIREKELEQKNYGGDYGSAPDTTGESALYSKVNGQQLGELTALVLNGVISNNMAKQILPILFHEETEYGKSPLEVATDRGYRLITDTDELAAICRSVIENSPEEMEKYKRGGKFARKITKYLVGTAMAQTGGNAHPERLNEVLNDILEEEYKIDD